MKDNIAISLSVIAIGMAGYAISIPTEVTNEIIQFDQTGLNKTLESFDQRITDQGLTIGQVQDNMSDIPVPNLSLIHISEPTRPY